MFNFFDRWWEKQQAKYPWLYQLDNADWKTWLWHTVIAGGVGVAIGVLPVVTIAQGLQLMAGFYVGRELHNIIREGNRDFRDAVMDVVGPVALAVLAS